MAYPCTPAGYRIKKAYHHTLFLLCLLPAIFLPGCRNQPLQPPHDRNRPIQRNQEIVALVRTLGNENYIRREEATKRLIRFVNPQDLTFLQNYQKRITSLEEKWRLQSAIDYLRSQEIFSLFHPLIHSILEQAQIHKTEEEISQAIVTATTRQLPELKKNILNFVRRLKVKVKSSAPIPGFLPNPFTGGAPEIIRGEGAEEIGNYLFCTSDEKIALGIINKFADFHTSGPPPIHFYWDYSSCQRHDYFIFILISFVDANPLNELPFGSSCYYCTSDEFLQYSILVAIPLFDWKKIDSLLPRGPFVGWRPLPRQHDSLFKQLFEEIFVRAKPLVLWHPPSGAAPDFLLKQFQQVSSTSYVWWFKPVPLRETK